MYYLGFMKKTRFEIPRKKKSKAVAFIAFLKNR